MAPPVIAAQTPSNTPSPSDPIDQHQVDMAMQIIRADVPMNESALAEAMRNPRLNQEERNLIIQTMAREDGQQLRFFANDVGRTPDNAYAALSNDQQTISNAVQQAYTDGAINRDDLVRIADANGAGNGAQRFMSILTQGSDARQAGGVAEVLADALWARNGSDGMDRANAAIFYTSEPSLMSRNLSTPQARAEAFDALTKFNEAAPYSDLMPGATSTMWRDSALGAAGRLFVAHSQELINHYTSAEPGQPGKTETLAKFMSQTVFNPDAQGIWLDRQRDLVPAIRDAVSNSSGNLLSRAGDSNASPTEQARAMRQYGQLTASISAGAAVALTRYDGDVAEVKARREEFAGLIGDMVGKLPLGDLGGKIADKVTSPIADQIAEALIKNPDRPDAAIAGALYDEYASQADLAGEKAGNPDLMTAFESGYSAELLNLQQNLNVNLGGHEK